MRQAFEQLLVTQYHTCNYHYNAIVVKKRNLAKKTFWFIFTGFKETAFAYAIMAAGMMMQVSRACAMGKLTSCGCKAPKYDQIRKQWQWDGCENNMHFAEKFTKRFLDSKEEGSRDLQSQMHIHNTRAGRMVS